MTTLETTRRLRCALFVDFDNVYIGLRRLDPAAAEAFAASPGEWLAALEEGVDADGDFTRRFLVRAVYLNPSVFSQFRPNFTRAGFNVVDCPSLTQQGKSSADINLVLDAVDALGGTTRYDEFVILSADADFTPLAIRFREADRLVTIIAASPAASAYRAVADTVITADEFVEMLTEPEDAVLDVVDAVPAESVDAPPASAPVPAGSETAPREGRSREHAAARRAVLHMVRSADRPLNGGSVAQAAVRAEPELGDGWDGAGSFFPWLSGAVPEVAAAAGFVWDPRRFSEADLPSPSGVDLPPLQRQVVGVIDIPNLPPERYRVLLEALAADLAEHPFTRPDTARRVRDACQDAGEPIGKSSVNTVISGVLYAGLDLATAPSAKQIAETWAENVIGLCRGARMEVSRQDEKAIREWVSGGLAAAAPRRR